MNPGAALPFFICPGKAVSKKQYSSRVCCRIYSDNEPMNELLKPDWYQGLPKKLPKKDLVEQTQTRISRPVGLP